MALKLKFMNIFAIKKDKIYVIEVNPRGTVPFVSKARFTSCKNCVKNNDWRKIIKFNLKINLKVCMRLKKQYFHLINFPIVIYY